MLHPNVTTGKTSEDIAEFNALARAMGDAEQQIDPQLENRASQAISEYTLNHDGVGYAQQGYRLPGGDIPAFKLHEHLVISGAIARARQKAQT